MAGSRNEIPVTWSAAASVSANSASRFESDVISINPEAYDWALQVFADNSGTPVTGDVLLVWLKKTTGDVKGDSGDDYDTDEHADYLGQLDTFASNTPGEDPCIRTFEDLAATVGKYRLVVQAPQGASRAITVRARAVEHKVQ